MPKKRRKKPGRPPKLTPQLPGTMEDIAKAIFRAAKPPDPSLRKHNVKDG